MSRTALGCLVLGVLGGACDGSKGGTPPSMGGGAGVPSVGGAVAGGTSNSGGTSDAGSPNGGGLSGNAPLGGATTQGGGNGGAPPTDRLSWSPEAAGVGDYLDYLRVEVTAGQRTYRGDGGDLYLVFPDEPWVASNEGGLVIDNARNVVVIGGEVQMPSSIPFEETPRRSVYLRDVTGVAFIEGLYIHGDGAGDIFTINAEAGVFYFQNIRAEISHAGEQADPVHADLIQPWGGHSGIHLDRFTGLSTYQGLQLTQDLGPVGPVWIRRTNLSSHPDGGSTANYLLWMAGDMSPVHVDGDTFFIAAAPDRTDPGLLNTIWPTDCEMREDALGDYATCGLYEINGTTVLQDWAGDGLGRVRAGVPPLGDYVQASDVGVDYVSPGYVE